MRKNLKHFPYIVATFSCFCFAFILLSAADREIPLAKSPNHVSVSGNTSSSREAIFTEMKYFTQDEQITLGKYQEDMAEPEKKRSLFVLQPRSGESTASIISSTYPDVNRNMKTSTHPLESHKLESWAGKYLIYGTLGQAHIFAEKMRSHGFVVTESRQISPLKFLERESGVMWSAIGIIGALAASIVASGFSRSKSFGIKRMHGHAIGVVLAGDLREMLRITLAASIACMTGATCFLWIYNGAAQIVSYIELSAILCGASLLLLFLIQATVSLIVWNTTDILSQVKGRLNGIPVIGGTYALRAPIAIMLISMTATAHGSGADLQRFKEQRSLWTAESANAGRFLFKGEGSQVVDANSEKAMSETIGSWLEQKAGKGELHIAYVTHASAENSSLPMEILVVDSSYPARHPASVAAPEGQHLSTEKGIATLTVRSGSPDKIRPNRSSIEKALNPLLRNSVELRTAPDLPEQSKQFTYGAQVNPQGILPSIDAAAVITVPAELLTKDMLVSAATSGGVLAKDAEQTRKEIEKTPELSRVIQSVQLAGSASAQRFEESSRNFAFTLIGLLAGAAALIATSFGIISAYATVYRRRTYVRKIHGWSFARNYRRAFVTETVLWASLFALFAWQAISKYTQARTSGMAGGANPEHIMSWASSMPMSCVSVLTIGLISLLIMFQVLDQKIRATHQA